MFTSAASSATGKTTAATGTGMTSASASATVSGPAGTVTPFVGAAGQGKEVKAFAAASVAVMVAAFFL